LFEIPAFNFNPTIKRILGISADKLYEDWLLYLDKRYAPFKNRSFVEGEKVTIGQLSLWDMLKYDYPDDKITIDYYPVMSPDGRYIAWLSNMGRDYSITDLVLRDITTGKTKVIVENVDYRISWSHDSTKLIYVKRPERSPDFYDIYTYDVTAEKETAAKKAVEWIKNITREAKVGEIFQGKITRILEFGAFAEIRQRRQETGQYPRAS